MNPVRGLVFDLDGTLVDSYPAIAASLNHARAGWDLPPLAEEEVRRQVGRGLESLIADLVGPDRVEEGVARFRERYATAYVDGTRVLDGVPETLHRLAAAGYRLALASNKPARFSRPILELFGLARLFQAVEGPDTAGSTKPAPGMIRRCLKAIGVAAEEAVYIGDMALDVESGRMAGLQVLLVSGGSSPKDELERTGAPVLDSFGQLLEMLPLCGSSSRFPEVS